MSRALKTNKAYHPRPKGFTLLEVLVALFVFAVMSLMAYQGLARMYTIKTQVDQEMRFWRDLNLLMDRMQSDFTQLSPRYWRNAEQQLQAPLQSKTDKTGNFQLEILRLDGQREPLHLAYIWQNSQLQLAIWPAQNSATALNTPQVHSLLQDVSLFELAFMNAQNQWRDHCPENASSTRPRAVRIRIGFTERAVFERVLALP